MSKCIDRVKLLYKPLISPSPGGDALVTSGIMESLLLVLEWKAFEPMNITVSILYHTLYIRTYPSKMPITLFWSLGYLLEFGIIALS